MYENDGMRQYIHLADVDEFWDEVNNEFLYEEKNAVDLVLEHSLYTISKWEAKWHKAFLGKAEKTPDEMNDYVKCMVVNTDISDAVLMRLLNDKEAYEKINHLISDSHTATWFREDGNNHGSSETVTSELVYYWMISLQIPTSFEHWHLNRLMTLIRVCNVKNAPPKKRSANQIMRDNAALNAARKAKMGTKG